MRRSMAGSVAYSPNAPEIIIHAPIVLESGADCLHLRHRRGSMYALPISIPNEKCSVDCAMVILGV